MAHSRLYQVLTEAWERGFLEITIHLPAEVRAVLELEELIQEEYGPYGLREVHLVPGFPLILDCDDDPGNRQILHRQTMQKLSACAADYIARMVKVNRKHDYRIACAWGQMLREIADRLVERRYAVALHRKLEVGPALGVTSMRGGAVEANVISHDIARAFGGTHLQLPTLAFVPRARAAVLKEDGLIREMVEETLPNANLVVTSLGGVCPGMYVTAHQALNPKLAEMARKTDAVGEMNYNLLGPEGEPIETEYETVGLRLGQLKKMAKNPNKNVALVAGGEPQRFAGIRAALLGGYTSVLISDTVCARYLAENAPARMERGAA